jgi:hypothetical protein
LQLSKVIRSHVSNFPVEFMAESLLSILGEAETNDEVLGALVTLLDSKKSDELNFQVLCVLTEIVRDHAKKVGDCGIIPRLKKYLQFGNSAIRVQAASALIYIAGQDEYRPPLASDASVFFTLLKNMEETPLRLDGEIPSQSLLPFCTYLSLLSVLLGPKGAVSTEIFNCYLPFVNYIRILLQPDDRALRSYCCSCLSSISRYSSGRNYIVSANIIPELLHLISVNSAGLKLIIISLDIIATIAMNKLIIFFRLECFLMSRDYFNFQKNIRIFFLPLKKKMNCYWNSARY